jgi:hypothetical protein
VPVTGPVRGALALVVLLFVAAGTGRVVGVGPLAGIVPADQVTDPREMIARSLQATLDAASVHVGGTLEGTLPGAMLERDEAAVDLAGTMITADLRPGDARTQARVTSPALGVDLETITIWTDAWYRSGGGPWQKGPVEEATSGTGVDANPLTLVDRMRSYLSTSGRMPAVKDVACASASGRCHEVRLDAGTDPAGVLTGLLPGATDGALPPVSTVITLQADALTLRPASLVIEAASPDGTIHLRLDLVFATWDGPVRIDEPPGEAG